MRYHCRTQHGFDPMPRTDPMHLNLGNQLNNLKLPAQSHDIPNTDTTPMLSTAAEKFLNMMHQRLTFEGLGSGYKENESILDPTDSLENTLNYLIENFVIMRKRDIEGISGYVCDKCLSFQFQYIKDIRRDLPATERHQCQPSMKDEANRLQNKNENYKLVLAKSYQALMSLTNSLFGANKRLIVESSLSPPYVTNLHLPLIKFDTITRDHWAWNPISNKITALTEMDARNFIKKACGTYCFVCIEHGVHVGYHLIFIRGESSDVNTGSIGAS